MENPSPTELHSDFADADEVAPDDVGNWGVTVSVPKLVVSTNEQAGNDECINNVRVINPGILLDLTKMILETFTPDPDAQIAICKELIRRLLAHTPVRQDSVLNEVLQFFEAATEMSQKLDVDKSYCDLTNTGLSFDLIRRYENDPDTLLLKSAEPVTLPGGESLYSQMPTKEQQNEVRRLVNDTEHNRILYTMAYIEKFLLMREHYVPIRSVQVINLTLYYLCVLNESRPVRGYCLSDLKCNLLGYLIDTIVRSRVIQAWQRYPATRTLMADFRFNYDSNNPVVAMCAYGSAQDRANYFLEQWKQHPELAPYVQYLNYKQYMEALSAQVIEVNGKTYYNFDEKFIMNIVTAQNFTEIIGVMRKNVNDAQQ